MYFLCSRRKLRLCQYMSRPESPKDKRGTAAFTLTRSLASERGFVSRDLAVTRRFLQSQQQTRGSLASSNPGGHASAGRVTESSGLDLNRGDRHSTVAASPPLPLSVDSSLQAASEDDDDSFESSRAKRDRPPQQTLDELLLDARRKRKAAGKYTTQPAAAASHKHYVKYLDSDTPVRQYTQVLIWCLERRRQQLEKRWKLQDFPMTVSDHLVSAVLTRLSSRLLNGKLNLDWTTRSEDAPLGGKVPNVRNIQNKRNLELFRKHLSRIRETKRQWAQLLSKLERSREQPQIANKNLETDPGIKALRTLADKATSEMESLPQRVSQLCAEIASCDVQNRHAELEIDARRTELMQPQHDPLLILEMLTDN